MRTEVTIGGRTKMQDNDGWKVDVLQLGIIALLESDPNLFEPIVNRFDERIRVTSANFQPDLLHIGKQQHVQARDTEVTITVEPGIFIDAA